jgi:hypothetical protein
MGRLLAGALQDGLSASETHPPDGSHAMGFAFAQPILRHHRSIAKDPPFARLREHGFSRRKDGTVDTKVADSPRCSLCHNHYLLSAEAMEAQRFGFDK